MKVANPGVVPFIKIPFVSVMSPTAVTVSVPSFVVMLPMTVAVLLSKTETSWPNRNIEVPRVEPDESSVMSKPEVALKLMIPPVTSKSPLSVIPPVDEFTTKFPVITDAARFVALSSSMSTVVPFSEIEPKLASADDCVPMATVKPVASIVASPVTVIVVLVAWLTAALEVRLNVFSVTLPRTEATVLTNVPAPVELVRLIWPSNVEAVPSKVMDLPVPAVIEVVASMSKLPLSVTAPVVVRTKSSVTVESNRSVASASLMVTSRPNREIEPNLLVAVLSVMSLPVAVTVARPDTINAPD